MNYFEKFSFLPQCLQKSSAADVPYWVSSKALRNQRIQFNPFVLSPYTGMKSGTSDVNVFELKRLLEQYWKIVTQRHISFQSRGWVRMLGKRHCDNTVIRLPTQGYVEKQPVAWKVGCIEKWCSKVWKHASR